MKTLTKKQERQIEKIVAWNKQRSNTDRAKLRDQYEWRLNRHIQGEEIESPDEQDRKIALSFLEDMERYLLATKEGRLLCIIHSVSSSGMSRTMSFHECAKYDEPLSDGRKFTYQAFRSLFKALGHREAKREGFVIGGCGMDMIFSTHYNVINVAKHAGIITKAECSQLEQMTPTSL